MGGAGYKYELCTCTLSRSPLQTNLLESMELEVEMVLLGANLNLSLAVQATSPVNSFPIAFTAANIPILVATLATNIWAIYIIQRKETSRINRCPIQILILANNSYINAFFSFLLFFFPSFFNLYFLLFVFSFSLLI